MRRSPRVAVQAKVGNNWINAEFSTEKGCWLFTHTVIRLGNDVVQDIRLLAPEVGGGRSNTGWAQVVCSVDGLPMTAYAVVSDAIGCGEHARFASMDSLVTVTADRADRRSPPLILLIQEHLLRVETNSPALVTLDQLSEVRKGGNRVQVVSRQLWRGYALNQLPEQSCCFQLATKAAAAKARCLHCREPHFPPLISEE